MTDVLIVTRDIHGRVFKWLSPWSSVCQRLNDGTLPISEDDEILLVSYSGMCLYSALSNDNQLTIDDLTGFFG